jgi:hypothetical protein
VKSLRAEEGEEEEEEEEEGQESCTQEQNMILFTSLPHFTAELAFLLFI